MDISRGHQGKLTDDEYLAANVHDGAVHHAVFIVKDPQADNLLGQPFGIVCRVFLTNADQYHVALLYGRLDSAVDGDGGVADALYYNSHKILYLSFATKLVIF